MIGGSIAFLLIANIWLVLKVQKLERQRLIDRVYMLATGENVAAFMKTMGEFISNLQKLRAEEPDTPELQR